MSPLTVRYRDETWTLDGVTAFSVGRSERCSLCIGPDDRGISRTAAVVESESATWWLRNPSTTRSIATIDEFGIRTVVAPGRRVALDGAVTIVIEGAAFRYAIEVDGQPAPPDDVQGFDDEGLPTAMGTEVVINDLDRLALAAMFQGYLESFPRHDPHPRSYADAATTLGWPRTTVVKRIEYIRSRLTRAGVPNLIGDNALHHLAEYVLTTRLLTKADLDTLKSIGSGKDA
jgi:hypothetical protein